MRVSNFWKAVSCLLSAVVLVACGGGSGPSEQAAPPARLAAAQVSAPATAADYFPLVQQLYIAYFGRPADSGGLNNFASQLLQLGAPTDMRLMTDAYNNSSALRALVDSFGTSAESQALYSGDDDAFVTAIYQNVLGRQPLAAGKAFWTGALAAGTLSRADASMSIMAGAMTNTSAQGQQDAQLVANRTTVATAFTAAMDTDAKVQAYRGATAAATVRSMLAQVNAGTDPVAFGATISATINSLVASAPPSFATVRAIINQRCVTCHSGGGAQAGLHLDDDNVVHTEAALIESVVVQRIMPFGNQTNMTDDERNTIKSWFLAGAH